MDRKYLAQKAANTLEELCVNLPSRRVGSPGNQAAARFIADTARLHGWSVDTPEFECQGWEHQGAELTCAGEIYPLIPSPHSLGGRFRAPLVAVSEVDELEGAPAAGRILLLHGEIAKEPLMPKNFPFYNPEAHQRIYALLEKHGPQAILSATGRNPEMAGALYPYPMFDDGDFDIPSAYLTDRDGERLLRHAGEEVTLEIRARRSRSQGCNVTATRPGGLARRVLFTAHLDAKEGTPGALDNAAGCAVLLLLAELLKDTPADLGVEITAFNGEDYYAAPGEQLYLKENAGRLEDILLVVNLDGLGYVRGKTAYSLYNCSPQLESLARETFAGFPGMIEGDPWYQGDHTMFVMNGRPAIAITSAEGAELGREIIHTGKDIPEGVDPEKLAETALALKALVYSLNGLAA